MSRSLKKMLRGSWWLPLAVSIVPPVLGAQAHEVQILRSGVGSGTAGIVDGDWLLATTFAGDQLAPLQILYRRQGSGWAELASMHPPSHASASQIQSNFNGHALDGRWVALGNFAFDQIRGTVQMRLLDDRGQIVNEQRIDYPRNVRAGFGISIAIEGSSMAIGAPQTTFRGLPHVGEVWIYELVGQVWEQVQILVPDPSIQVHSHAFGRLVHLDGDRLFVGGRYQLGNGIVHVYERASTGRFVETQTLTRFAPLGVNTLNFGVSMATWNDWLLLGSPRDFNERGRAYLYHRNGTTNLYTEVHEFRSHLAAPPPPFNQGNGFGYGVGIWDGIVVVADSGAWDPVTNDRGAIFVFRPDALGLYPTIANELLRPRPGIAQVLGGVGRTYFEGGIVTTSAHTPGTPTQFDDNMFVFSAGPESSLCSAGPGGVSTTGIQLDTFADPAVAGSVSGRGLLLSSLPAGSRFMVLGSLTGQSMPAFTLLGVPGLCLNAPYARVAFGAAGGSNGLALIEPDALTPQGDHFLTGFGTVHLQALCFPPGPSSTPAWTNGISLFIH